MSEKKEEDKKALAEKYKLKGAQQISYAEYEALRAKKSRVRPVKIPFFAKFIFGTPFIIIFCCGIVFLPYIIYLIATSPSAPPPKDEVNQTNVTSR